ncbi:DUF6233 domain-containing protein, partial [Streptomyces sp. NPDC005141]
ALRALTEDGVTACPYCRPDTDLVTGAGVEQVDRRGPVQPVRRWRGRTAVA